MKSNEYLYGKGVEVEPIPKHIVEARIELLKNSLRQEINRPILEVDYGRIKDLNKAVKHWTALGNGEI